jgi:hypothetical protein
MPKQKALAGPWMSLNFSSVTRHDDRAKYLDVQRIWM